MSFSSEVKNEIARIENEKINEAYSELSAIIRFGANFYKKDDRYAIEVLTENAAFARRLFSLIKKCYDEHTDIEMGKNHKLNTHHYYIVRIENETILNDMYQNFKVEYTHNGNMYFPLPEFILESDKCIRTYIRGVFICAGSISNPDKMYHLEITSKSKKLCDEFNKILLRFELKSKILKRKNHYICYIKESEAIVDFLSIIGAHHAMMKVENVRILKEVRNQVNREVNCETANLDKTVKASVKQVNDIKLIMKTIGFNDLNKTLYEIAMLRLENENATLLELGKMLSPPISKSGVNHRLKRIAKIAQDIRKRQNEKNTD